MTKTIAVTGGAGFIGAAIIGLLIEEGLKVRALARRPEKFARFKGAVEVAPGAVEDESSLATFAQGADALIHCAGVTHARRDGEYAVVNAIGAANVAAAAARSGALLVHFSSMSARLPSVSPYAASKAAGERGVAVASGANRWIALRAPAIYGPGDRATLPYFRMVKRGVAAEPMTTPDARASLLYVDDIARAALFAALEPPQSGVYEVGDETPEGRRWADIGQTLAAVMGVKARRVRVPRFASAASQGAVRACERLLGRPPSFRTGQVAEFFHPDWTAKAPLFSTASRFRPATPLEEGFAKTVLWYQDEGVL